MKNIVRHQLAQVKLSWDGFANLAFPLASPATTSSESTPINSLAQHEVASSCKLNKRIFREEVTKTYSRGKRLVFSLEIVERAKPIVGE